MSDEARVARREARVPKRELADARFTRQFRPTRRAPSPLAPRASRLAPSPRAFRPAFTLVELLVSIVIVAIIAAAVLGTATAALDAARRSRTETLVNRIHLLLMERWESYETRRVDLNPVLVNLIDMSAKSASSNPTIVSRIRGQMLADLRLLALRELIKYEMPDRWSDVTGAQLGDAIVPPLFLASRPALAESYLRFTPDVTEENEGAECLYALIIYGTGDGEARSMFSDQDVGDLDDDGAPEFLDGWGNPIAFLRWAPGVVGRSAFMSPELDPKLAGYDVDVAVTRDHDPFDLFRRDVPTVSGSASSTQRPQLSAYPGVMRPFVDRLRDGLPAFRMVPLVFSAGPDEQYDVITDREVVATAANTLALDPCAWNSNIDDFYFGRADLTDDDDQSLDNITNHALRY